MTEPHKNTKSLVEGLELVLSRAKRGEIRHMMLAYAVDKDVVTIKCSGNANVLNSLERYGLARMMTHTVDIGTSKLSHVSGSWPDNDPTKRAQKVSQAGEELFKPQTPEGVHFQTDTPKAACERLAQLGDEPIMNDEFFKVFVDNARLFFNGPIKKECNPEVIDKLKQALGDGLLPETPHHWVTNTPSRCPSNKRGSAQLINAAQRLWALVGLGRIGTLSIKIDETTRCFYLEDDADGIKYFPTHGLKYAVRGLFEAKPGRKLDITEKNLMRELCYLWLFRDSYRLGGPLDLNEIWAFNIVTPS